MSLYKLLYAPHIDRTSTAGTRNLQQFVSSLTMMLLQPFESVNRLCSSIGNYSVVFLVTRHHMKDIELMYVRSMLPVHSSSFDKLCSTLQVKLIKFGSIKVKYLYSSIAQLYASYL